MSGVKSPKQPDDPDPSPISGSSDANVESQSASRNERKRVARSYGRAQTVLAGNSAADNAAKKTVLG